LEVTLKKEAIVKKILLVILLISSTPLSLFATPSQHELDYAKVELQKLYQLDLCNLNNIEFQSNEVTSPKGMEERKLEFKRELALPENKIYQDVISDHISEIEFVAEIYQAIREQCPIGSAAKPAMPAPVL